MVAFVAYIRLGYVLHCAAISAEINIVLFLELKRTKCRTKAVTIFFDHLQIDLSFGQRKIENSNS